MEHPFTRLIRAVATLILLSLLLSNQVFAAITGVSRTGDSTNCSPSLGATLTDGSIAYCDQSYTWTDFPPEVDGVLVDFIVVADADNAVADYGLSITVDNPGSILLFIDPMVDVGVDMSWVIDDGYTEQDTIHFSLDKGGSTVVFDLWVRDISDVANPIITGPQNDGNASNYGVAYATDEADLSVTLSDDPDPYVIDSGVNWTRTYMIENLGPGDTDEIVVTLSGAGITGSTFVSVFNTPQLHL